MMAPFVIAPYFMGCREMYPRDWIARLPGYSSRLPLVARTPLVGFNSGSLAGRVGAWRGRAFQEAAMKGGFLGFAGALVEVGEGLVAGPVAGVFVQGRDQPALCIFVEAVAQEDHAGFVAQGGIVGALHHRAASS